MKSRHSQPNMPFGINLYGYLTSNIGLGVAGRNTAQMLAGTGVPLKLIDVNPGGGMQGKDSSLADAIAHSAEQPDFRVNLFHINPDQVLYQLRRVELEGRLNACVPFWELPRLPQSWVEPLRAMDLILAPTRFVEGTIRASLPEAAISHYAQAVHVPEDIVPDRRRLGLPKDAFVVVMSFDMRSDIERKNPWAAIDAFHRAFPNDPDVRLVIKASNVDTIAGLDRHVKRLREVAADERVVVQADSMSYRDILTLYASSDVLVSLHRAEGLGLSLLEAMALGKPVVGTAWSGNMDFMTPENSVLVGYREIEVVSSTQPAYGKGMSGTQHWADPNVDEAATGLRRLRDEPELAARLGARGRADALARMARYDSGADVVPVLEALAHGTTAETAASAVMRSLERRYLYYQGRRIVRAVINRTKTRLGL